MGENYSSYYSFGTDVGAPIRTLFQGLFESILARRNLTVLATSQLIVPRDAGSTAVFVAADRTGCHLCLLRQVWWRRFRSQRQYNLFS